MINSPLSPMMVLNAGIVTAPEKQLEEGAG